MTDCFAIWLKAKRLLSNISDEALYERQSQLLVILGGIRGILQNLLKDVDTVHPEILDELCHELQPKESDSYSNLSPLSASSSSSLQSSHILDLPDDIQNKMCQYLTIFDLKNIQLTCLSLAIIARAPFNTHPARIQLYSSSLSYDLKTRLFQSLNTNSSSLRFYFSHLTNRETRKLLIDIGAIPRYSQLLSSVTSSKLFNDCADNLDDLCIMFTVNDPYFKIAMKQMIEYKAIRNHCNSSLGGIRPTYVSYYSSKSLRPLDSFSRLSQNSKNMILYILSDNQQENIHGMKDLQKIFDTNAYSQGVLRQLFATGIILKFVEFCDSDNYELQLLGLKAIKHIIGLPTTTDNYFSHAIVYGFIDVLERLTEKGGVHITIICKIIHGIIRHKHDQLDEIKHCKKWKVSITKNMITSGLNQQYQTKIYVITDMFRSIMSDGPIFGNDITYQELDDIISNMVLLLNQLNDVDHENNNNNHNKNINNNINVNADRHFIVRARINLIWSISYLCKKSRGINDDNDCNFTENIIDLCIKHGFLKYTMDQLRNGDVGSKIQWNLQILNACMYSIVMLVKNGGKHALWIKNTDFLQFIRKYMASKATAKQVISILNAFSKLQNEAIDHLLQHKELIEDIFSIITQHSELQSKIQTSDKNDKDNKFVKLLSQRRQLLDVTAYKQLMTESNECRNGNMVELATGKTAILHYMG